MPDLSVVIPSRNEMFLKNTIEDLLKNIRGDTEIIAILDGGWAVPQIVDNERVTLIYHSTSIGQRAGCNEAVNYSRAKYIMKCDAHCSFDEGFDVKMLAEMKDDWTMVPIMRNLHAFNWLCKNGHRRYQGPSGPCKECGEPAEREVVWIAKNNPQSTTYCFDSQPHFQYFNQFKSRPEAKGNLTETMSLQGSCFMMTKEKYLELGINEESYGSWGSEGLEVAIKTWLSGGRVICNKNTYYAHMFRTQGGDFGFPYSLSGRQVDRAKRRAKDVFFNNRWPMQKYPLVWLVDKFKPVPGWHDKAGEKAYEYIQKAGEVFASGVAIPPVMALVSEKGELPPPVPIPSDKGVQLVTPEVIHSTAGPTRGIVYYSDNLLAPEILDACQKQLLRCMNGHRIVSVTLAPMNFGENHIYPRERSVLTMFNQILEGIKLNTADIIYLTEHDVLYTKEHFQFTPPRKDVYYYNENQWQVDAVTGRALFYHCMRLSTLCAYRELLLEHYTKRVERFEKEPFTLKCGYEPGGHRFPRGIDNYTRDRFMTPYPLIDLRHEGTVSHNRWRKRDFRNQGPLWSWTESDSVPYFGQTKGRMPEFLRDIADGKI